MKQNYIDGKGVYHNELNYTLAQIYDSGVEFGCKVTAEDKAEDIINELEKIKAEIGEIEETDHDFEGFYYCQNGVLQIIDKHISELKGENK